MSFISYEKLCTFPNEEIKNYLDALETEARFVKRFYNSRTNEGKQRASRSKPMFSRLTLHPDETLKFERLEAAKLLQGFLNNKCTEKIYSSAEVKRLIDMCIERGSISIGLSKLMSLETIEKTKLGEKYFIVEPS